MIITKLTGGIGNQMFQYACAKNISLKKHSSLAVDITSYSWDTLRKYDLDNFFAINCKIASTIDVENTKMKHRYSFFERIKRKLYGKPFPYYLHCNVKEQSNRYDSNIWKVNKNIILEGFWQSEKYFIDIKEQLLQDFTFKNSPNEYYNQIINQIQDVQTVSVHIRRGDYVHNSTTLAFHGICSLEYYNNAISYITHIVGNPSFIFISDDIEWCKQYFKNISNSIFIENNKGADYEDLRLMTLCKHNIIANSSFSWWGAWLNVNPNKIVIAPKQWFANQEMQAQTQDLIPESWIQM
jgi:hypothetical protein